MSQLNVKNSGNLAYFSMEIALRTEIPTYSGGLGVLAGDTIHSAADLELPMVAVSLMYRKGFYHQELTASGEQKESPITWHPEEFCEKLKETTKITIEGREVTVQGYRYDVKGVTGHVVPVFFLDTDCQQNSDYDRMLTDYLYGGDERYRLCQETLLGMGGIQFLSALGYSSTPKDQASKKYISRYHMNEGHAALLTLQLFNNKLQSEQKKSWDASDVAWVKDHCLFTTHTPVPAGHDTFTMEMSEQVLGKANLEILQRIGGVHENRLNVSHIALGFSNYVNGVSKRHGEISKTLLHNDKVEGITNGVHLARWASAPFAKLFDQVIPLWRKDNFYLRNIIDIEPNLLASAHEQAKAALLQKIEQTNQVKLDPKVFTLGFARRATEYKRATLLFEDLEGFKALAKKAGPLQLVFAGKAHPKDFGGKKLIQQLFKYAEDLKSSNITMVYIPNYDVTWGNLICAGVDVWLNTPLKPLEASGTSGMKAALNGVPSLSTLDGWWIEGCIEGVTGWEVEDSADAYQENTVTSDARLMAAKNLMQKLETQILPIYYHDKDKWSQIMKNTISINASYFNTQRMVIQYAQHGYYGTRTGD